LGGGREEVEDFMLGLEFGFDVRKKLEVRKSHEAHRFSAGAPQD
jgi:hypothetical protein